MNFIGKLLVVAITVTSVAFLGVAIVLYSSHHNWKATVDEQKATITSLRAEMGTLETKYKQDVRDLDLEIEAAEYQVRKLERERVALVARNAGAKGEIVSLNQVRRDTIKDIAQTQTRNQAIASRNAEIEQEIQSSQEATNAAFEAAVTATSELHGAKAKLEIELERNAQLLEQTQGNLER